MTAGGGMNPETNWDEARLALGRVAELFSNNPDFTQEDLYGVENYEAIPEPVRQTVENLTPDERRVVASVFTTLAENHFYLENNLGRMEPY